MNTDYCYVCDRITEWDAEEVCSGCGRTWGHEPPATITEAADLLRQALADAPDGLHVARDYHDALAIFDADDVLADNTHERDQALMPLVGLLLAAAPHLVDLLDVGPADRSPIVGEAKRAITEAAQAMEVQS